MILYYIRTWEGKFRTTKGHFVMPSELKEDEKLHAFNQRDECDKFIKTSGIVRAESWGISNKK